MTWRADTPSATRLPWGFRVPVLIDGSSLSGVAGADTTNDVQFVLPDIWDLFWTTIDSNGYELRVCDSDGTTALTYQRTDAAFSGAFSKTNRDGGIQVDGVTFRYGADGAGRAKLIWLYFGLSGAANSAGSFVAASALTGKLELGRPPDTQRVLRFAPEPPGQALATLRVSKGASEKLYVWADVTDLLLRQASSSAKRAVYEEIVEIFNSTETGGHRSYSGGSLSGSLTSISKCRFAWINDRMLIRVYLTGGTSGTNYTVDLPFRTTLESEIHARFIVQVRDVAEV